MDTPKKDNQLTPEQAVRQHMSNYNHRMTNEEIANLKVGAGVKSRNEIDKKTNEWLQNMENKD